MAIVAQEVLAQQFLDEGTVGIFGRVAVSERPRNALMKLDHNQETNFGATNVRLIIYWINLFADSLQKLGAYRPDQAYVFEHNFEQVPILLVVHLEIIGVNIDIAPSRVAYAPQNDVQYLEDRLTNTRWELI